ncbi:MAG TPA: sulfate permease [Mycobacterium sp.]|nr:MAG: sulfate permease [Mycobacterium sp.]HOB50779.1 sulfate permease [Mycobacterium sp.]HQE15611.1 sulfate permease [Mycobacterium sp.]
MTSTPGLAAIAPGFAQFRSYDRKFLRGDVVGGLTVAAYLVPQVMAYATLAGLPAVNGLWCALVPLVVYAFFGTSRLLSAGPESTTALMTATAIAPLAAGDAAAYASMAAVLAIMVGLVCLFAGIIRLGFLADLLSRPVLVGYMTGLAVIMICSQLGKLTGAPVEGDGIVDQIASLIAVRHQLHVPTLLFSLAVLATLLAFNKLVPKAPGPLIAVLLATAAVAVFGLDRYGIKVIGDVPAGLPQIGISHLSLPADHITNLMAVAVGIAVVAFADTILTARTFAARDGSRIDANAELRAMGIYNVGSAFTHGFPVSSSASRTALGYLVGARTQMYSLVAMVVVVVIMLTAHSLLANFPTAALGALVVYAGLRLIEVSEFARLGRFRASELILALSAVAGVLLLGILPGVIAAVGISILDLLRRVARPHDGVLGFVPGLAGMHDVDDYPDARLEPGLLVYRYDAPLFFANAENFVRRALRSVRDNPEPVQWFILNAEANVEVDLSALDAVRRLREILTERGIVFGMARVKQDLRDALEAAGLVEEIGEDNIYPTLPTAVAAYRNRSAA